MKLRRVRLRWMVLAEDGWTSWRMAFITRWEALAYIAQSKGRWPNHRHHLTVWTGHNWPPA